LLAPSPTPKLEDQTLSAVRDCLLNIFAATLHIGGRSSGRRWEDNIKMDTEESGMCVYGMDRAGTGYGQVVGNFERCNEYSASIK
jgi:hypothetical protein